MQLSDDGQWMWNGTDWIPAGQPAVVQPLGAPFGAPAPASISMPQMNQPQIVYVHEEKSSKKIVPWIGVGLILLSLFLPYLSILGFFEISGFEMIGIMGEASEMFSEDTGSSDSDGYDEPGGDDEGLGSDEMTLLISGFMFFFSPLFFILTSVVSGILLFMGKSTKIVGIIHLSYVGIFLLFGMLSPSVEDISIFSFVGIGFYLGAFSGGAFLAK